MDVLEFSPTVETVRVIALDASEVKNVRVMNRFVTPARHTNAKIFLFFGRILLYRRTAELRVNQF